MRQIPPAAQYLLQSLRGLRNLSRRCRRSDRSPGDGRAPYISARVICAHGDLSPLALRLRAARPHSTPAERLRAALGSRSFIAARSSRGEWRHPSRPIATLVYLHFAAAIRRVVGCGMRRGRGARPLRGSNTPPPAPRRSVNFVMSKVDNYATQVASTF